jgi:hypothetical protein
MYAVLQASLDQSISREALEEAVSATEGLTKPDCARIQHDMFGIVAEGLSEVDARGLQAGLRTQGVETEVVSDFDLPSLAAPHRLQTFAVTADGLTMSDYTGQDTLFPLETFIFAAGGHVKHLAPPRRKLAVVQKFATRGEMPVTLEMVMDGSAKEIVEFRVEFYVTQEPFRFQSALDDKAVVRANGEVLKLRDRNQLDALLLSLANTLPPDQINVGIKKVAAGEDFVYPSVHAFEREIVWSLYQLAKGSA